MGKSQRIKGRAFEQWVAKQLRGRLWPEARRGLQCQEGGRVADIENTPYHVECSCGGESIWAKWKQANDDSTRYSHKVPIVIKKRDRDEVVVMLSFETFVSILGGAPPVLEEG